MVILRNTSLKLFVGMFLLPLDRVWGDTPPPLATSAAKLHTYTGEEIPVLEVEVSHASQRKKLSLIVTRGDGPSLLGRNWLAELQIDWRGVYQIQEPVGLTVVLKAHIE